MKKLFVVFALTLIASGCIIIPEGDHYDHYRDYHDYHHHYYHGW